MSFVLSFFCSFVTCFLKKKTLKLTENFGFNSILMFGAFFTDTELKEPGRRGYMTFGSTGGNIGQQGTNSGNVAVGHQWNGGYYYGRRGGHYFFQKTV
jgi:hypothetical protein